MGRRARQREASDRRETQTDDATSGRTWTPAAEHRDHPVLGAAGRREARPAGGWSEPAPARTPEGYLAPTMPIHTGRSPRRVRLNEPRACSRWGRVRPRPPSRALLLGRMPVGDAAGALDALERRLKEPA
jgi:hypothetical protein